MVKNREEISRRIKDLEEKIEAIKFSKKKKIEIAQSLYLSYKKGDISQEDYKGSLNHFLEGNTFEEWEKYYDGCINVYNKHLEFYRGQAGIGKIKLPTIIILPVLFVLILGFVLFFVLNNKLEISFSPDTIFTEDCLDLSEWPVQYWFPGTGSFAGVCVASGPCTEGCSFDLARTEDLSRYLVSQITFDYQVRNMDPGEFFTVYLNDGNGEVPVFEIDGNGGIISGRKTINVEDYITLTNAVNLRFNCRRMNSANEICLIDNVIMTADTLDVEKPVATINTPQERLYYNNEVNPITYSVHVTDNLEVGLVQYELDGGVLTDMTCTGNVNDKTCTATDNTVSTGVGHLFEVFAKDTSNNLNNPTSVLFDVNRSLINGCGAILKDPGIYYQTVNIPSGSNGCVIIKSDGIIFDGQSNSIAGPGGLQSRGIVIYKDDTYGVKSSVLKNTNLNNFGFSVDSRVEGAVDGQSGTNMTIINSNLGKIISKGENPLSMGKKGGNGGSIFLYHSNVLGSIDTHGGNGFSNTNGGTGGEIYVEKSIVDISNLALNLIGGTGLVNGVAGRLIINYTSGFNDVNTNYGSKARLSLVNGSRRGGRIDWINELSGLTGLANKFEITFNHSYVNGLALPVLNSIADISHYDMTDGFTNPVILRDGIECTDCVAYTGLGIVGTVRFGVTGFSSYEIGEGPSNQLPVVNSISTIPDQTINEGGLQDVLFTVTVFDADGHGDINNVKASFIPPTDPWTREDVSCVAGNIINSNTREYTCDIGIWYYDEPGAWDVSATATDSLNQENTLDEVNWFNLFETLCYNLPGVSWSILSPGGSDVPADSAQVISNCGNGNHIGASIIGQPLIGDGASIPANSFSVNENKILVCNGNNILIEGLGIPIPNAVLPRGEGSTENLYYCAESIPSGLPSRSYSGFWDITFNFIVGWIGLIFAIPVSVRRKKKKEIIRLAKELSSDELFAVLSEKLVGLMESRVKGNEVMIPISIFSENLSPAEALCKYLNENKELKFSEIAKLIGRNQRTVWTNCNNAGKIKIQAKEGLEIPARIFDDKDLSILEAVVCHLKNEGYSNLEIAKILNRDSKNVWTLYSRAKKKKS